MTLGEGSTRLVLQQEVEVWSIPRTTPAAPTEPSRDTPHSPTPGCLQGLHPSPLSGGEWSTVELGPDREHHPIQTRPDPVQNQQRIHLTPRTQLTCNQRDPHTVWRWSRSRGAGLRPIPGHYPDRALCHTAEWRADCGEEGRRRGGGVR